MKKNPVANNDMKSDSGSVKPDFEVGRRIRIQLRNCLTASDYAHHHKIQRGPLFPPVEAVGFWETKNSQFANDFACLIDENAFEYHPSVHLE